MAIETTLTAVPENFPAGVTVSYLRSVPSGYGPGDGWTLKLYLAGESTLQKAGADEDGSYRITLAATDTAQLEPGRYRWIERLSDGSGEVHDFAAGIVIVEADVGVAAAGELQSWEEKTLPIVELAIAGRLPSGMENYQVFGRAIGKIPIRDLLAIRTSLQADVNRLRNPGRIGRPVKVQFPPA